MKIHIIGGSGTGKTFIAEKISSRFKIPHLDLDEIFWDNSDNYNVKMPIERRTDLLNEFLANESWVIEGVYLDWLSDSFSAADYIFVLKTRPIVFNTRIILRFIRRKLGLQKGGNENLKSLFNLLIWTNRYHRNLPGLIESLSEYSDKLYIAKNNDTVFAHLNNV